MLVLGHRGAPRVAQENTLPAFRAALDQGADGVELDVRRTADGSLAICHNSVVPDGRTLLHLRRDELPPEMPVLDAALDVLAGAAVVNIEIKNWPDDTDFDPTDELAQAVVALLDARGELHDPRYVVSCFHLPTVDRVHDLAPALATGWLVFDARVPDPLIRTTVDHGHTAFHPHVTSITPELVDRAHAAGLAVNTWTSDDPERLRWMAEIGVDAVVTNVPNEALAALGRAQ